MREHIENGLIFTAKDAESALSVSLEYGVQTFRYTAKNPEGNEIHAFFVFDNFERDNAAIKEFHRQLGEKIKGLS